MTTKRSPTRAACCGGRTRIKARTAFERAIELGNEHARIDLAKLHEAGTA